MFKKHCIRGVRGAGQCYRFSQTIAQDTPQIIYFYYKIDNVSMGSSIQKDIKLILKKNIFTGAGGVSVEWQER